MYVVYDETTTDGVTERRLLAMAAAKPKVHLLPLAKRPARTRRRKVLTIGWWNVATGAAPPLPDDEDAFCLADGRLLIFRP